MITAKDKPYLNNRDYNMALEKFYAPEIYADADRSVWNGTVNKAYPFSNEQLNKIFRHWNSRGNRVLTVGSSGDQLLNAIYYGAQDITVLDANLYAKPYIDYKIAAIKNLTYSEIQYYFILRKDPFRRKVYSRIFHDLPEDSQQFWGTIFMEQDNSDDTYSRICRSNDISTAEIQSSFFNSPRCYKKLQKRLKEGDYSIEVINAEFFDFAKQAKGTYDTILLSNIYKYVSTRKFGIVVNDLYHNHLSEGGVMQLHYEFGDSMSGRDINFRNWIQGKHQKVELSDNDTTYLLRKPRVKTITPKDSEFEML